MNYSQVFKRLIFNKSAYFIFVIVLILLYNFNVNKQIVYSNQDFIIFDFYSDTLRNFEIEIYNNNGKLKLRKKINFDGEKPVIFEINEEISKSDIIHLTFNENGVLKYKSIKIKQNKNLLSIGISDFEDYFIINKNLLIEGSNIHVNLKNPGKARLIMKALTNKMINIK